MSEPVIKATTRMCSGCGHTDLVDRSFQPWMHCSFCDADTDPLYTHDDLVRVAREALATWCQPGESLTDTCNSIVDRLTKGET